jgi:hypothetical protein
MSIAASFPLFLFLISLASPFGIPLGETFFVVSAGLIFDVIADFSFIVILIFAGLFAQFLLKKYLKDRGR